MMKHRGWTEEQINYLERHYPEMTAKAVGKELNRTETAIHAKASRTGFSKFSERLKRIYSGGVPSKEAITRLYLKDNNSPRRIAEILKVEVSAVYDLLSYYQIRLKRPQFSNVNGGLAEKDRAYLAGYLDGDGTITAGFYKNKRNRKGYGVNCDVALITRHKDFAQKLREIVGGNVSSFIYRDSRHKKEGYRLGFTNQASALEFLKEVYPYLILKQKQASLMIQYLSKRLQARDERGNSAPISDESRSIIIKIKELNK